MIQRENELRPVSFSSSAEESLYNLSILLEMDDKEYVIEIVTMFLNDTPKELTGIKEALAAGNTEAVHKKAHKLKSSAGILQANNLIDTLSGIERLAKTGNDHEKLRILFENAGLQYKNLETALYKLLKSMKA